MESADNNTADGCSDRGHNAVSVNTQDQALLKALQEFVIPFIRGVVDQKSSSDIDQIPVGPAGKLIAALKEFISGVVCSQPKETVLVSLSEDDIALHDSVVATQLHLEEEIIDYDGYSPWEGNESPPGTAQNQTVEDVANDTPGEDSHAHGNDSGALGDIRQRSFEEQLLGGLREHVFNKMPIRLLSFKPNAHGTGLQITLVERGAVYAHFEAMMKAKIRDPEFRPVPILDYEFFIDRLIEKYVRYAILSHTWLRTALEVTYNDWNKGIYDTAGPGYRKLVNFCKVSWRDNGIAFGWMDTICINKDSSTELDESIRSMYNWYKRAATCSVYLAETKTLSDISVDPWFTRGWTLQELLAPDVIKFYNNEWAKLVADSKNDKENAQIMHEIWRATTISKKELDNIRGAPISRRMQLAAKREVTREEDSAYSLMGIFGVSIATAYGEGADRAFSRLLQEILATTAEGIMDIFNWAGVYLYTGTSSSLSHNSCILPHSPQSYRSAVASDSEAILWRPIAPLTLTNLGLHVSVILMPATLVLKRSDPLLQYNAVGDFKATVGINEFLPKYDRYAFFEYRLLDRQIFGGAIGLYITTFAIFSFTKNTAGTILISKTCMATALLCTEDAGKVTASGNIRVVHTAEPIVFNLSKESRTGKIDEDNCGKYYQVKIDELPKHGMQLVSLYL